MWDLSTRLSPISKCEPLTGMILSPKVTSLVTGEADRPSSSISPPGKGRHDTELWEWQLTLLTGQGLKLRV